MSERWTVSEVARLAKVTVRTLHHYDRIGLLEPSDRSDAGYRLYSRGDLERLQQILIYRALDFRLEGISGLLEVPPGERLAALDAQLQQLRGRRRALSRVIRTVEDTIESMKKGEEMATRKMFEGFEDLANAPDDVREHHRQHAQEAHERWGGTDAYAESMKRVKGYSKDDWAEVKAENESAEARMAQLLAAGADPAGEAAMRVAEDMRLHIDRRYYPCSHRMHAGLAEMYEADPRFRGHYEERAEGLAAFVAAAIRANADQAGHPDAPSPPS